MAVGDLLSERLSLIRWCAEHDTDDLWRHIPPEPCVGCGEPASDSSLSFGGPFHLRCLVRFWEEFMAYEDEHPVLPTPQGELF